MLDFETLGSKPDTIVITLGAVAFNKTGIIGEELFEFDVNDQIQNHGRGFDYGTLSWWMRQSDQAREQFQKPEMPLTLMEFRAHFESFLNNSLPKGESFDQIKPWGNGANFDISIMEHIYKSNLKMETPWKFWNVHCFRTLHHLTDLKNKHKRGGVFHNALDDARYQAECVIKFFKEGRIGWKKTSK